MTKWVRKRFKEQMGIKERQRSNMSPKEFQKRAKSANRGFEPLSTRPDQGSWGVQGGASGRFEKQDTSESSTNSSIFSRSSRGSHSYVGAYSSVDIGSLHHHDVELRHVQD